MFYAGSINVNIIWYISIKLHVQNDLVHFKFVAKYLSVELISEHIDHLVCDKNVQQKSSRVWYFLHLTQNSSKNLKIKKKFTAAIAISEGDQIATVFSIFLLK